MTSASRAAAGSIVSGRPYSELLKELDEKKRALADAVLRSGEAALTELSDADLADLVSLRRRP